MKIIYLVSIFLSISLLCFSQQLDSTLVAEQAKVQNGKVYKMKYGLDNPITVAGTAWTLYGFSKIYGRDKVPEAEILALDPADLNSIDRSTADNYSDKAKNASDKFFYGSMPAPLIFLLDKKLRKDAAKIGLLYLEAMAITGTVYTAASMSASRFRPYAYNPNVEMGTRIDVDYFKNYNDEFGHAAGDQCLMNVSQILITHVRRAGDLAARIGGDEFALILANTDLDALQGIAESVLNAINDLKMEFGNSKQITLSIGLLSAVPHESLDEDRLLQGADRALYRAQSAGRNQVACVQPGANELA